MTLRAEGLAVGLGPTPVIENLSLSLEAGARLVVIGPNGAGKSTLLRTLAGLVPPKTGRITLDGDDLTRLPATERVRRVAYMAQEETPAFPFTVSESVALGATATTGFGPLTPEIRTRIEKSLRDTEMTELRDRPLDQLSGGERQRARLARALAQDAPWLFLDEPTAALDFAHAAGLPGLLRNSGRGVIVAVHDLSLAARLGDTGLLLGLGGPRIGPIAELLASSALDRAYGTTFWRGDTPEGPVLVPQSLP